MGLLIQKPEGSVGSAFPAILVGLFVAFGGVLFGYVYCVPSFYLDANYVSRYDTGTIGGILGMKYWKDTFSTGYVNPKGEPDITAAQSPFSPLVHSSVP
jgi:SP family sugar:H+ symporter-like MFS transporter